MAKIRQFLNKEKEEIEAKMGELREKSRTVLSARERDLVGESIRRLQGQTDMLIKISIFLDNNP